MDKKRDSKYDYFFMGGLPRSGNTLLSVLLNQNPQVYVSKVSALPHFLFQMNVTLGELSNTYDFNFDKISMNMNEFLIDTFYNHIEKRYVIDKSRAWNANIPALKYYLNDDVRVLCPYRPIPEIVVSFLRLMEKDKENYLNMKIDPDAPLKERCNVLWEEHLREDVENVQRCSMNTENVLMIKYDDLVNDTDNVLKRIYKFLGIPEYTHRLVDLKNNRINENGNEGNFEVKNLHNIRSTIEKTSVDAKQYLGDELFNHFNQFNINI